MSDRLSTVLAKFFSRQARPGRLAWSAAILSVAIGASSQALAAAQIKVGLIYEARAADQPWSAAIYDAAQKLAKQYPSIRLLQSYNAFDATSAQPVAQQLISAGVSVLDFHSFALNDVAHALAKKYPRVVMSVSSFDPPSNPT